MHLVRDTEKKHFKCLSMYFFVHHRFNSESQQVIIDSQELGNYDTDLHFATPYPATVLQQRTSNPRNNIASVKVSNDIRGATNSPMVYSANGDQAVADLVGAIAKPIGSRGRQISSAKKNNLGEWEKGAYDEGDEKVDTLKKEKSENMYVDLPQRELPVGAVAFKNDQYRPTAHVSPSKNNLNLGTNSPMRQQMGNHGDMGIEESIVNDHRQLQESNNNTSKDQQTIVYLKDNPVFQGSDDEDGVPTSFI